LFLFLLLSAALTVPLPNIIQKHLVLSRLYLRAG
jgi:hypothetical protein